MSYDTLCHSQATYLISVHYGTRNIKYIQRQHEAQQVPVQVSEFRQILNCFWHHLITDGIIKSPI